MSATPPERPDPAIGPPTMPRLAWANRCLLGSLLLGIGSCGPTPDVQPNPPLPMGKVAPTLPRLVRGLSLAQWLAEMKSETPARRSAALYALSELLTEAPALEALLSASLSDPSADVRHAALVAVGRLPAAPSPALAAQALELLAAPEPAIARSARALLPSWEETLAGPALERVWFPLPGSRPPSAVLGAVGRLGSKGAYAARLVVRGLEPADEGQRDVLAALERLGAAGLAAALDALANSSEDTALHILAMASTQGERLGPHVEVLGRALKRSASVRRAAAEALYAAGAAALPVLDRLSSDADPEVASTAQRVASDLR